MNPDYRRVKIHYSYEIAEVAALLKVHRNTVRGWLKDGLPAMTEQRPFLIQGAVLIDFLKTRRQQRRRQCAPGELYCLRCREPRRPAGDMVDYKPSSETLGALIGICPMCDALMYRAQV